MFILLCNVHQSNVTMLSPHVANGLTPLSKALSNNFATSFSSVMSMLLSSLLLSISSNS